jgi:hypothetical protein
VKIGDVYECRQCNRRFQKTAFYNHIDDCIGTSDAAASATVGGSDLFPNNLDAIFEEAEAAEPTAAEPTAANPPIAASPPPATSRLSRLFGPAANILHRFAAWRAQPSNVEAGTAGEPEVEEVTLLALKILGKYCKLTALP